MNLNLPEHTSEKIRSKIISDLQPSLLRLHIKLASAVFFGGILSLAICGQFGMGLTSWAEVFTHKIHESMPTLLCAPICGIFYAFFPMLSLRLLLCSPLQFRIILKKKFLALGMWYLAAGFLMTFLSQHDHGTLEIVAWHIAAVGTSYMLSIIFLSLIPRYDPLVSIRSGNSA